MLCLFNGIPESTSGIKEPSEGIRLGVDTLNGIDDPGTYQFTADYKNIDGIQVQNKTIPVGIEAVPMTNRF